MLFVGLLFGEVGCFEFVGLTPIALAGAEQWSFSNGSTPKRFGF